MVCFRSQLISKMGLAMARLDSALPYKPVALQREKVSPHRVVSEPQLFSQLVNSSGRATQQADNTPAGTFKKSFVQGGRLHTYFSIGNIHRPVNKHNKSREALTYSATAV